MKIKQALKCNNIDYRKGYFVVEPNIHDGCVNLEAWNISAEFDIEHIELESEALTEEVIAGNVEIELNISEAEELVDRLKVAIEQAKSQGKG